MKDRTTFYRLSSADQGIVVFLFWQSLSYGRRLALAFGLILAGFVIQVVTWSFLAGFLPLLAGSILLLVKGYNNRVDFGRYDATAQWEPSDIAKLDEIQALDKRIRQWDASLLDVSSWPGSLVFIGALASLGIAAILTRGFTRVLVLDAMVLLLPHWITGIRSALVLPRLLVKVRTTQELLRDANVRSGLKDHKVDLMVLLKGKEKRLPDDIKLRVTLKGQPRDFLGLYAQVVVNEVNGTSYPYLYVVLVAKRGYGLRSAFDGYRPAAGLLKEFKEQDEAEVLVIRQKTAGRSGYSTSYQAACRIFLEGLSVAQGMIASPKPS